MDFNADFYYECATDFNFIQNCFCDFSHAKIVGGSSLLRPSITAYSLQLPTYFCMAKITEAILNKIKVCGTFIIKFYIEIHLLKDDSRYHENK